MLTERVSSKITFILMEAKLNAKCKEIIIDYSNKLKMSGLEL